ncbi:MAG TPA: MBL fold metallo-hydrolase [Anaerolineales bacterium]|nr:MBL fold metallo-hydrolase [Anaerolineales bacterium]
MQVIQDIGTANVFCVGSPREYMLIDAGIFMKTKYLIQELITNKYKLENLKTIILTHCHCDHIGGVKELLANSNASVAAHKNDVPYILQQAVIAGPYRGMMIEEQKTMKHLDCVVPRIDLVLDDESRIENLDVIPVPGHTPGSIALYQRDRKYMFFGDVIRESRKDGLSIGKPEKFNVDTEQVKVDAKKLLSYEIEYGLLSHGKVYAGKEIEVLRGLITTA